MAVGTQRKLGSQEACGPLGGRLADTQLTVLLDSILEVQNAVKQGDWRVIPVREDPKEL